MSNKDPKNLVWLDLEMSGLDVDKEVILEIATIVTDSDLNVIEEGPNLVIYQKDNVLNDMDEAGMLIEDVGLIDGPCPGLGVRGLHPQSGPHPQLMHVEGRPMNAEGVPWAKEPSGQGAERT